jgi:hypothetical protein
VSAARTIHHMVWDHRGSAFVQRPLFGLLFVFIYPIAITCSWTAQRDITNGARLPAIAGCTPELVLFGIRRIPDELIRPERGRGGEQDQAHRVVLGPAECGGGTPLMEGQIEILGDLCSTGMPTARMPIYELDLDSRAAVGFPIGVPRDDRHRSHGPRLDSLSFCVQDGKQWRWGGNV